MQGGGVFRTQDGGCRVFQGLGGRLTEGNTAAQIKPCRSKTSREKKGISRPDDVGGNGPTKQRHCERRDDHRHLAERVTSAEKQLKELGPELQGASKTLRQMEKRIKDLELRAEDAENRSR
ncbi:hypothetical protein NDU88_009496 [Pleurodeles waltl]|uniref:Uncharacterized protein n=1 Tax=Pleurodeles waltl TaxID=8319 RepID=A0AAV7QVF8_PLEWA|nr:hypothetical protein NDU88_009496 [Pleurodeles waltl]